MATATAPPGGSSATERSRIAQFKHTRASRWMHWINFPLITIMVWSGLRIYRADVADPYGVGVAGWHWFDLLPEWINSSLGLTRKLAKGMAFHFTFGWLFTFNGIVYAFYLLKSGEWRHIVPDRRDLKDVASVVLHDLKLRKSLPLQGRYNAAQKVAYSGVLFLGMAVVVSGLAILSPTQLSRLTWALGGYEFARTIHFSATVGFVLFFVTHLLQVARAGWPNFAAMVTGYELKKKGSRR